MNGAGSENARAVLLDVRDLEVEYAGAGGRRFKAVRGVSFTLHEAETLGIVGESGSGKSTIARALTLLQPIASGRVTFRGRDIGSFGRSDRAAYRSKVQMVFQDATGSLNPRMTVRQTLAEALRHAGLDSGQAGARTVELLELTGLSRAVLDQYPRELSGGQCQRVSFARALSANPEVLVADEPVSALDVSVQARILNLMRGLRRELGLAIVLIAHDLAVVRNVCDNVCVMHQGVFEDSGPAGDVFANPSSPYTRSLLAAVPSIPRRM